MKDNNPYYSKKLIAKYLFILIAVAGIMKLTNGIGFAVIIPFAFAALTRNRPDDLFFYMFATIAMVVANPIVVSKSAMFFVEQRAMMVMFGLILATKVAGQKRIPYLSPFLIIIFYILYMILPSYTGWCPLISYAKLFLFGTIFLAYYGAANMAATQGREFSRSFRSMALSICIFFLIGSVLVIPYPGISQLYEEMYLGGGISLFRGITAHSNCCGPMISGMCAFLYADMLFGLRKYDKLYIVLLLCCPLLIWKTSSRTAMATMISGLCFATFFFSKAHNISGRWKGKITSMAMMLLIGLCLFVMLSPSAREKATTFIAKQGYEGAEVTKENVLNSRMGLMTFGLENFKKKPLFGNGFQVAPQMEELSSKMEWYQLLSAPIEKGVWTTAILEEGGVIGMGLFILFIFSSITTLLRYKAYMGATTLFVFIVSNFGEFSFFSMSFLGGFMWTLVFTAIVIDAARIRQNKTMPSQLYNSSREMPFGY